LNDEQNAEETAETEVAEDGTEVYYDNYNEYTYYNDISRIVYSNAVVYNIGQYYIEAFNLETAEKLGEVQVLDSNRIFERDTAFNNVPVYNGAVVPEEPADDSGLSETTDTDTTTVKTSEAVTNG